MRTIAEGKIVVKPLGRTGSKVPPASERIDIFFAGATEPWTPPVGDPAVLGALASAQAD